jgi:hypothetical protein
MKPPRLPQMPQMPPRMPGRSTATVPTIETGPAKRTGDRLLFYGTEGAGKTTLGAYAPDPVILMGGLETGYLKLLERGKVPSVPRAQITAWDEVVPLIRSLLGKQYKTVVIDSIGSFEALCHALVQERHFDNDYKSFSAFGHGERVAARQYWLPMLDALEALAQEGKRIILIGHSLVKDYANPEGEDFKSFFPDLSKSSYSPTHRWVDATLFMNFVHLTKKDSGSKTKGYGTGQRWAYCQYSDGRVAKERLGLPASFELPSDPAESWNAVALAMEGNQ